MNQHRTNPTARHVILIWLCLFAIWFVWESGFRILLQHPDWNGRESLKYSTINLVYGIAWSLLLGILNVLLLTLFSRAGKVGERLSEWLTPQEGVVVTALVAVPLLYFYRDYLSGTTTSMLFRWTTGFIILVVIYVVFHFAARTLALSLSQARTYFRRTIFVLLFLLPLLVVVTIQSIRDQRPSEKATGPIQFVVLISIDTLRYDYVGAYGASNVHTPALDHVASEGVLFQQAIASAPITGPSHASMFTGESPLVHGVRYNGQPLSASAPTFTRRLRDAGFRTGGFIASYPLKRINCGLHQGFQVYDEQLSLLDFFNETFYGRIVDALPFFSFGILRLAPEVTDAALQWLQKNYDAPFFLFVHYYDPHYPYGRKAHARYRRDALTITATPQELPEQKRLYAGEVELVDGQIERIIDFLKQKQIYDKTLLIITADHGESLGEHNYYYSHDRYLYEQLLRVPMMIRCPLLIRPQIRIEQQVALLDIHKTILGAVGLKPAQDIGGYDLLQLIKDPSKFNDRPILSHCFMTELHSLRVNNWKLIKNHDGKEPYELYDLKADPGETMNLWTQDKNTFATLQGNLDQLLSSEQHNKNASSPEELSPEQKERLKSLGYLN